MVNGAMYLFRPSILYTYITGECPSNTTTSDLLAEDTTLSTVDFRASSNLGFLRESGRIGIVSSHWE